MDCLLRSLPDPRTIQGKDMGVLLKHLRFCLFLSVVVAQSGYAQKALTWQEVRDKFEAANPSLRAGQIGIDESRAAEITAYLRPNPTFTLSSDGTQIAPFHGVWKPSAGTTISPSFSYLHERHGKRELRRESAQHATELAVAGRSD